MNRRVKVGTLVKTHGGYGEPTRIDRVASITKNTLGTTIYILENGGGFSEDELSIV